MKLLYTLLIITLCSFASQAQQTTLFNLNFEDSTVINQVFYTDSILDSLGVWQIGMPAKPIFDSAYSPPNAIVTELDTAMPAGVKASFIIEVPVNPFSFNGYDSYLGSALTFVHKYDFDSAKGGGYVEYSADSGNHWHPVLMNGARYYSYPPGYNTYCIMSNNGIGQLVDGQYIMPPSWWSYIPMDTTSEGIPYFTGTDSSWIFDTIVIPAPPGEKTYQNNLFLFRFTAFTDSNSAAREGWMIDNISFQINVFSCPGGINEINSSHLKVYPDPASDIFTISMMNEPASDYVMTLCDISGRVVMTQQFTGQETVIQRGGIDAGSYFIQVTDKRTQNTFQKRMVFE